MGKFGYSKQKTFKNSTTYCECGGHYTNATYSGSFANLDPKASHERSKLHQNFLQTGEKKVRQSTEEKKMEGKVQCGCGSTYSNTGYGAFENSGRKKHERTKKHQKWLMGQ